MFLGITEWQAQDGPEFVWTALGQRDLMGIVGITTKHMPVNNLVSSILPYDLDPSKRHLGSSSLYSRGRPRRSSFIQ
jgi:hypothetical protein